MEWCEKKKKSLSAICQQLKDRADHQSVESRTHGGSEEMTNIIPKAPSYLPNSYYLSHTDVRPVQLVCNTITTAEEYGEEVPTEKIVPAGTKLGRPRKSQGVLTPDKPKRKYVKRKKSLPEDQETPAIKLEPGMNVLGSVSTDQGPKPKRKYKKRASKVAEKSSEKSTNFQFENLHGNIIIKPEPDNDDEYGSALRGSGSKPEGEDGGSVGALVCDRQIKPEPLEVIDDVPVVEGGMIMEVMPVFIDEDSEEVLCESVNCWHRATPGIHVDKMANVMKRTPFLACKLCDTAYLNTNALVKHLTKIHKLTQNKYQGIHICLTQARSFFSANDIRSSDLPMEFRGRCWLNTCEYGCTASDPYKPVACKECRKSYGSVAGIINHLETEHDIMLLRHYLHICPDIYRSGPSEDGHNGTATSENEEEHSETRLCPNQKTDGNAGNQLINKTVETSGNQDLNATSTSELSNSILSERPELSSVGDRSDTALRLDPSVAVSAPGGPSKWCSEERGCRYTCTKKDKVIRGVKMAYILACKSCLVSFYSLGSFLNHMDSQHQADRARVGDYLHICCMVIRQFFRDITEQSKQETIRFYRRWYFYDNCRDGVCEFGCDKVMPFACKVCRLHYAHDQQAITHICSSHDRVSLMPLLHVCPVALGDPPLGPIDQARKHKAITHHCYVPINKQWKKNATPIRPIQRKRNTEETTSRILNVINSSHYNNHTSLQQSSHSRIGENSIVQDSTETVVNINQNEAISNQNGSETETALDNSSLRSILDNICDQIYGDDDAITRNNPGGEVVNPEVGRCSEDSSVNVHQSVSCSENEKGEFKLRITMNRKADQVACTDFSHRSKHSKRRKKSSRKDRDYYYYETDEDNLFDDSVDDESEELSFNGNKDFHDIENERLDYHNNIEKDNENRLLSDKESENYEISKKQDYDSDCGSNESDCEKNRRNEFQKNSPKPDGENIENINDRIKILSSNTDIIKDTVYNEDLSEDDNNISNTSHGGNVCMFTALEDDGNDELDDTNIESETLKNVKSDPNNETETNYGENGFDGKSEIGNKDNRLFESVKKNYVEHATDKRFCESGLECYDSTTGDNRVFELGVEGNVCLKEEPVSGCEGEREGEESVGAGEDSFSTEQGNQETDVLKILDNMTSQI